MNLIHVTTSWDRWEIKPLCSSILCLYSIASTSSCLVTTACPLLAFSCLTFATYLIALFASTRVGGALGAGGGGGSSGPTGAASAAGGAIGTKMGGGGGRAAMLLLLVCSGWVCAVGVGADEQVFFPAFF